MLCSENNQRMLYSEVFKCPVLLLLGMHKDTQETSHSSTLSQFELQLFRLYFHFPNDAFEYESRESPRSAVCSEALRRESVWQRGEISVRLFLVNHRTRTRTRPGKSWKSFWSLWLSWSMAQSEFLQQNAYKIDTLSSKKLHCNQTKPVSVQWLAGSYSLLFVYSTALIFITANIRQYNLCVWGEEHSCPSSHPAPQKEDVKYSTCVSTSTPFQELQELSKKVCHVGLT